MSTGSGAHAVSERSDFGRQNKNATREQPTPRRFGLEPSDISIVSLDYGLRVLEANGDFIYQLGKTASEVYGQNFGNFVHTSVKQVIMRQLNRLGEGTRDRFSANAVGVYSAGTTLSVDMTGVAVRGDSGQVSKIVLVVQPDRNSESPRPVTDRRKLLSELDARVLEGVAAGNSTVQLASKLYLSRQGIEYHVGAMLRRFKSPNRSALVAKAYSQGILSIGQWPPKVISEYVR